MPIDPFASFADNPSAPAGRCFAVTPSDGQDLPAVTKALYIGIGGDLVVTPVAGDADVLFRNVPQGAILDVRTRAVRQAGTTAAAIVGLA